jgi:hypothetical protein
MLMVGNLLERERELRGVERSGDGQYAAGGRQAADLHNPMHKMCRRLMTVMDLEN